MPDSQRFEGFDHIDCRVRSLSAVEAFYDALMPELGLPVKGYSFVDEAGEWHEASAAGVYNTVEYYEERAEPGRARFFMGIVERGDHTPGLTRIAFRVSARRLYELETKLAAMGAVGIERETDMEAYPAIFFEDPAGTKLEIVARTPSNS